MPAKTSPEIEQEILRLYQSGESQIGCSRQVGCSQCLVARVLNEHGIHRRDPSEAQAAKRGLVYPRLSDEQIWKAYCDPNGEQASLIELSRRWGCSDSWLKRRLAQMGEKTRSISEQMAIEIRSERHPLIEFNRKPETRARRKGQWTKESHPDRSGPKSPEHLRRIGLAKRRRVSVNCWWCGKSLVRIESWARSYERQFCNQSCANQGIALTRFKGRDAPRPLIVEKLRQRVKPDWTEHQIRTVAPTVGATDPEIRAVMPPIVRVQSGKRKTTQRAIKAEQIGSLGAALINAQRQQLDNFDT